MTALGILWFVLIFVLMAGYFVLDGFDLGVGVLSPFLGKDEKTKKTMVRAIGPLWDGNEVWLLTAGGALFAAFAPAYATSFSGFYLAIMLVLFGLIIRAAAVEFRCSGDAPKGLCDAGFFIGSLLPALLFGVAIGNVIAGIPLNINGDYTGNFFGLLGLFPLFCGFVGLFHMCAQGASWMALKTREGSQVRESFTKARRVAVALEVIAFGLATLMFFVDVIPNSSVGLGVTPLAAICMVVYLVCLGWLFVAKTDDSSKDLINMIVVSAAAVMLVVAVGATLFPYLIPATDPLMSLTIANSASSDTALGAMTIIACIGVPLVLIYHVVVFRIFRGRLTDEDLEH